MLEVRNVSAHYDVVDGKVRSVENLSLDIFDNEIIGIAGESGCGKSTLLKAMYGIFEYPLELAGGCITLHTESESGEAIYYKNEEIVSQWWNKISYIPQGAMNVMNPVKKVKSQFTDAIRGKTGKMPEKELVGKISAYLAEMDLSPEVLGAYPHQLSGGMRQRVLIALASFCNPDIIFADEPTTALDVVVQRGILTMLSKVQKQSKNSIVIVSHDMGVHYQITQRLAIMYAGQLVEVGKTEEMFENPRHPYTQMLINSLPRLGDEKERKGIDGVPPSLKHPPEGCRFAERCPKAQEQCFRNIPDTLDLGNSHLAACHYVKEGVS